MGGFVKGDVVAVRFPFTDLTSEKRRPALVLARRDLGDYILCQITSRPWHEPSIRLTEEDFQEGALDRESFARPDRVFTANEEIILRQVGRISEAKCSEVVDVLVEILR